MGLLRAVWWCCACCAAAVAAAEEPVSLRTASGRFLRPQPDGRITPGPLLPGEAETFDLLPQGEGALALRAAGGRLLTEAGPGGRILWVGSRTEPGPHETFHTVSAGASRVGLRNAQGRFVTLPAVSAHGSHPQATAGEEPRPDQAVAIYRVAQVPPAIPTALAIAVRGLVMKEIEGKEYDKVRSRLKEKYVELPAPTLSNLRRKKRRRLWAIREETHVRLRLDGTPQIRILHMPYLRRITGDDARLLMFGAEAELPVAGRVGYEVPERLSVHTSFRAQVAMQLAGQVRLEKSDAWVTLDPPEVLDLRIAVRGLDISNDLLNTLREPIEDFVNHEIRDRHARILDQANKAVVKAFDGEEIRHPLLRYLSLP